MYYLRILGPIGSRWQVGGGSECRKRVVEVGGIYSCSVGGIALLCSLCLSSFLEFV